MNSLFAMTSRLPTTCTLAKRVALTCLVVCILVEIAVAAGTADLKEAEQDPDFAVQGEYVGVDKAMQVIAMGDGEFDAVIYEGGLPGAGAKPNPRRIETDIDTVLDLIESMKLTRVQRVSSTLGRAAPAGATTLFDGSQASLETNWVGGKISKEGWLKEGTETKQSFVDYQLHLEFRTPWSPTQTGQKRGNSGVYHQSRYETQVLDSFGLEGLDNETGGIYTVSAPTVNACFPPMTWQTYDVDFTAARYDDSGKKISNAKMTVRLNGIMVQSDVEVPIATRGSKLKEGPEPGPIYLQNHGDPVRFRNIWLLPRDSDREASRPIVPGFERFVGTKSTSLADAGNLLISNLACQACHSSDSTSMIPKQSGPDLSEVAGRVRHDALVAMIADPHAAKPNTTMPDPWPGLDEDQRQSRAAKIASYLALGGKGTLVDRYANDTLIKKGEELYHQVGCVACHASRNGTATPQATTVPLGDVHLKYTVPSLAGFLRNANHIRPGIRMPALLGDPSDAMAIAGYLTQPTTRGDSSGQLTRKVFRGEWSKLPDFNQLKAVETTKTKTLEIQDIRPRNRFGVVFEGQVSIESDGEYTFILKCDDGGAVEMNDQRLEHDGIHPATERQATYTLSAGIYPLRIEYFDYLGESELSVEMIDPLMGRNDISVWLIDASADAKPLDLLPSKFQPDQSLIQEGKQLFAESGCIHCHTFGDQQAPSASPTLALDGLDSTRGCLADEIASPAVDYRLGASQVTAIRAALTQGMEPPASPERSVHLTLAALNCYACHERGKIGGPEPSRDAYFTSTVPEMGLEGRLPPSLQGVGDKLNDEYLKTVFNEGAHARDYMHTRMPAFNHGQLKPLVDAIVALDRRDEMESTDTDLTDEQVLINGRKLCGDEGLSCVKCHSFAGNKGGGLGAIDMLLMPERLRESWFQRYLQDPTKYRPGTRMPNSFVDGRSALTDINDGSPPLQIDAMWRYLSQGDQAKEPLGLNQAAIILKAVERPRIYRNFFTDISARGIGVAYPTGMNLLWDAESMTLSRAWKNEFVDAAMHWVGRGQGRQKPQGDAVVSVDVSVPVARLESINTPWPTETARQMGYRFSGYRLDRDGNPGFDYSVGNSQVQDRPLALKDGFERQLSIDAKDDLVVQLAEGKIQTTDEGYRVNDRYTVKIQGVAAQLVTINAKQSLRAMLPASTRSEIIQTITW